MNEVKKLIFLKHQVVILYSVLQNVEFNVQYDPTSWTAVFKIH